MRKRGKRRVRLFHFGAEHVAACIEALSSLGFEVEFDPFLGPSTLREMRAAPPDATVIDMSRAPSQGRDIGVALRSAKSTRLVPLVFVDGADDKVERTRQILPDATYTTWEGIRALLPQAMASPPTEPVVPGSTLAGYAGTPLPKKLGITEGTRVALLDPPPDARRIFGALPAGVSLSGELGGDTALAIWFVRSLQELRSGIRPVADRLGNAHLWIVWPKKTSALAADVGQQQVREAGLGHGLVDYKVCAIDATWSGLKFVRRAR